MRKAWQLIALAAVLTLATWLGSPKVAQAYPSCSLFQGKKCLVGSPPMYCGAGDFNFLCNCVENSEGDHIWVCAP